jgi:hypothetical protein
MRLSAQPPSRFISGFISVARTQSDIPQGDCIHIVRMAEKKKTLLPEPFFAGACRFDSEEWDCFFSRRRFSSLVLLLSLVQPSRLLPSSSSSLP